MDTILEEDWSYFNREYKAAIEGCDKEGRPGKCHTIKISSKTYGFIEKPQPKGFKGFFGFGFFGFWVEQFKTKTFK